MSLWPKLCNRVVNVEKHTNFARGRLTFWKVALALVSFSWCAWIFLKPWVAKPLFLRGRPGNEAITIAPRWLTIAPRWLAIAPR